MIPYIKDNFRGGISDESTRGPRGSWKYAYGLDIHKRRDSLSCNWAMSNVGSSTIVNDLVKYAVTASDGTTYAFGNAGSVYAITGNPADPVVSFCYNDENGEIRGAAEWQESDGVNYLYWATATSIARKRLDTSSDTPWPLDGTTVQDYKTNLDDHPYHTMKNAAGSLMIANGEFLAKVAYDGSYTNAAVNLRPGNRIKCLEERDDYVILGTERTDGSEEGHIWNWVVTNTNWSNKRKLPVKGINALIDAERLMAQGGNGGEIFFSDFTNVSPLNSIPAGGECNSRIDILNDLSLFGIYGAGDQSGIYSYGRRMLNRQFALNHEFRLAETVDGNTVDEIGAVWVNSSAAFASYKTEGGSTYYGIDMVSSSTRANARVEGLEFNGGSPHLRKTYNTEKVVFEPLPSGCSISVIYKPDRQTTGGSSSAGAGWKYADVADGSGTTYSVEGSTEAEFIISNEARVFEVGLELTANGSDSPEVTASVGYLGDETKQF